jgi:hypothetical protein
MNADTINDRLIKTQKRRNCNKVVDLIKLITYTVGTISSMIVMIYTAIIIKQASGKIDQLNTNIDIVAENLSGLQYQYNLIANDQVLWRSMLDNYQMSFKNLFDSIFMMNTTAENLLINFDRIVTTKVLNYNIGDYMRIDCNGVEYSYFNSTSRKLNITFISMLSSSGVLIQSCGISKCSSFMRLTGTLFNTVNATYDLIDENNQIINHNCDSGASLMTIRFI